MSLQAVLFDKRRNTPNQAARWLAKEGLNPIKQVHTTAADQLRWRGRSVAPTANFHRYRIEPPTGQMRTMTLDKKRNIKGVVIVNGGSSIGVPRQPLLQGRRETISHRSGSLAALQRAHQRSWSGSIHLPSAAESRRHIRRNGGAIGSDLAVGTAVVGSILAGILGKKLYDHVRK